MCLWIRLIFWRNIDHVLKYGQEQLNETKKFDMNNKSPSRLSKGILNLIIILQIMLTV